MPTPWYNNVLGFVPKEDWLDVGNQVTRQNDPTDIILGDDKTENLIATWESLAAEYQIPMMAQFHGFDTESQKTFRVPVDTHNIEKGLIKVKLNQSERIRALLGKGVREGNLYDYVINDGIRLADQVVTRSKVAKNEMLATGRVTIKENDLDLVVDYGVPNDQLGFTLDFSDNAQKDILAQIQDIVDAATDKGITLTGMYTSNAMLSKLRKNAAVQKAVNGNVGAGALVKKQALLSFLDEEFGITTVVTNDLTYGASATIDPLTGRPSVTTQRYFPKNKITFFAANPNGKIGTGLWGNPPELDAARFMNGEIGTENSVSPYVYVNQWAENDPAVLWTKASGLFMPVLYNPNSLFIATEDTGA